MTVMARRHLIGGKTRVSIDRYAKGIRKVPSRRVRDSSSKMENDPRRRRYISVLRPPGCAEAVGVAFESRFSSRYDPDPA
jgi:hypothetical protein